jgi:hypothetical protein
MRLDAGPFADLCIQIGRLCWRSGKEGQAQNDADC